MGKLLLIEIMDKADEEKKINNGTVWVKMSFCSIF